MVPSPKFQFHCVIVVVLSIWFPERSTGIFKQPFSAVIFTIGTGFITKVLVTVSDTQPIADLTTNFITWAPVVDTLMTGWASVDTTRPSTTHVHWLMLPTWFVAWFIIRNGLPTHVSNTWKFGIGLLPTVTVLRNVSLKHPSWPLITSFTS